MPTRDAVSTTVHTDSSSLVDHLGDDDNLTCWLRHGEGMIGLGVAHARTFTSASAVETWWNELTATATINVDESLSGEAMASPVAFISFPFSPEGSYEIVVPRIVIGRRKGQAWMTVWSDDSAGSAAATMPPTPATAASSDVVHPGTSGSGDTEHPTDHRAGHSTEPHPPTPTEHLTDHHTPAAPLVFHPGNLNRDQWLDAVSRAIEAIRTGRLDKVVLARDEIAHCPTPIKVSRVLAHLAAQYPQTWTFSVKGLVGASPELLVRQDRGLVTSRVLAGTIPGDDARLADSLSSSSKDLAEHEYAVASVAEALTDHVTSLHVPEAPFVLRLPNVMHLASDITGAAKPGSTVLRLVNAIHPSAAVCGTPTEAARQAITDLEHMDRGRYAGPVGWVNASGDGEIALALRCGQIDGDTARVFAGCGIVAGSDPAVEWDETVAKLEPMKQALSIR